MCEKEREREREREMARESNRINVFFVESDIPIRNKFSDKNLSWRRSWQEPIDQIKIWRRRERPKRVILAWPGKSSFFFLSGANASSF